MKHVLSPWLFTKIVRTKILARSSSFFLVSAQTISHAGYPPWFPVHNSTWAFLAFMTYIFHSLAPHIYVWEMLSYLSLAQKIPHRPCQLMSFSTRGSADSTGKAPRGRERERSRWAERSPTYSPDTYNSKEPRVSANHSGFFFLGFQTGIEKASWDHCKEQHTNRPADQCKRHHCEFFKLDSNSLVLSK